ncbi:MAG: 50S ribosomal protein L18Ae [Candidatus Thermoplasmatota archaeon]|jgi:ribosomal protein L20A (L18A)|nr:50S ribosomal protein L18Ae [Candidatus Thermoplasmatota archaeon]MCL5983837.1 50S ribosomal protein L18Ae [Candidatus Thermoplasmatota archaeon]
MPIYEVTGRFLARRNDWQIFRKRHDATSPEEATEWALSEIGGCHHVARRLIRIESVAEAKAS